MKNDENNELILKIKNVLNKKFEISKKLINETNSQLLHNFVLLGEDNDEDNFVEKINTNTTLGNDIAETIEDLQEVNDDDTFDSISDTIESSIINTNRVLRFLQLLTENHHLVLQNFLREQKSEGIANTKSFDFVSHISLMFGTYIKEFTN